MSLLLALLFFKCWRFSTLKKCIILLESLEHCSSCHQPLLRECISWRFSETFVRYTWKQPFALPCGLTLSPSRLSGPRQPSSCFGRYAVSFHPWLCIRVSFLPLATSETSPLDACCLICKTKRRSPSSSGYNSCEGTENKAII